MNLYCESHGSGEALVLVPGFASGAWIWRWQVDELSKYFRVITFDPRGVARSANGGSPVSIELIADDIATILDELGIEKANVLGVSFGGFVAQQFAQKYPNRMGKLILACTSFGGPNHVAPSMEVLASFASTEGLNSSERIRKFMKPAFTDAFLLDRADIVEEICRLREENVVPESVYMQQLIAATTFNAQGNLSALEAETLVLSGDEDQVVPMQNAINLSNMIPAARLKIVKGGSHMFFIERPAEFNMIIKEFINGTPN